MMKRLGILLLLCQLGLVMAYGQATPPNLPAFRIDWKRDTMLCDYMFISTERFVLPTTKPSTAMILDRRGFLVWYTTSEDNLFTFSPQANGTISFNVNDAWYELDSLFNPSVQATCNGSAGDFHDFIHLANGNTISLCNDDTLMDLRGIYTYSGQEGDSSANVRYNTIEERSPNGNLIKRWRGIDHFSPRDVDSLYFFYPWYLELNHTNSMDFNGRYLLLSHRSNHEVTMVDWNNGRVVWRLGGSNNDFYFINDIGFKSQHDARLLSGNRVSVMDNRSVAFQRTPRGVVYAIDTVIGTATKEYEYANSNIESSSMGSFRVLPNGDGLVSWGTVAPEQAPNISYYQHNGRKVCDIYLQEQHHCYRAVCAPMPFSIQRPVIQCDRQNNNLILSATTTQPSYLWSTGATSSTIIVPDTGFYQLFVPLGMGFIGSNVFEVTDMNAACPSTPITVPQTRTVIQQLEGTFDLLGRPVQQQSPGNIYIERYRDGSSRKILRVE